MEDHKDKLKSFANAHSEIKALKCLNVAYIFGPLTVKNRKISYKIYYNWKREKQFFRSYFIFMGRKKYEKNDKNIDLLESPRGFQNNNVSYVNNNCKKSDCVSEINDCVSKINDCVSKENDCVSKRSDCVSSNNVCTIIKSNNEILKNNLSKQRRKVLRDILKWKIEFKKANKFFINKEYAKETSVHYTDGTNLRHEIRRLHKFIKEKIERISNIKFNKLTYSNWKYKKKKKMNNFQ